MNEKVAITTDDEIAVITLNSPANRNALSSALLTELHAALAAALADTGTRVIVLTGAGPAFCAGADLKEAAGRPAAAPALFPRIVELIFASPKPVICRVNGSARAGGIGLIAACDIAIAPLPATFAFTEVRIGAVPAIIAVPCLRRMPSRAAAEYFLTGETFSAERAREIGLLTLAVPEADLDAQTGRYANAAARGAGRAGRHQGHPARRPWPLAGRRAGEHGGAFCPPFRVGGGQGRDGGLRGETRAELGGPAVTPGGPVLRIANCSGFYGDRLSAAREMVEGGPIDVLTGDWLAELTMLLLAKSRDRGGPGYARTFLSQLEQVLATCLERGIRIVSNAGGLDPGGCAAAVRELAARAGLRPVVAHVEGDDILGRLAELTGAGHDLANTDTGERLADAHVVPVTANAYLGGQPIAQALRLGADVVITGRVTDAALVVGPGIWRFGWTGDDLDALAGAVAAGHIIECGCQATGGNYSFFEQVPDLAHAGFPLVELAADGSAVITKHPGTGGLVSVGTVTAQLLYEIAAPCYLNPDVTARFDTIRLEQLGPDRVRVAGTRGEPPPADLKVSLNYAGGYRNTMILVLEGLDVAAKAELAQRAIWARIPGGSGAFESVSVDLAGSDPALLRITVMDADRAATGRAFSAAVIETALASYPGLYSLTPPGEASSYGVFWPAAIPASLIESRVYVDGIQAWAGPPRAEPVTGEPMQAQPAPPGAGVPLDTRTAGETPAIGSAGGTVRLPLGAVAGARSGDKGGNANVGVWVRSPEAFTWLDSYLTADRLAELVPSAAGLRIDRYRLPNLLALNFVVVGLLGRGVAASARLDAQAKALGEELRAAPADIPEALVTHRTRTADPVQAD